MKRMILLTLALLLLVGCSSNVEEPQTIRSVAVDAEPTDISPVSDCGKCLPSEECMEQDKSLTCVKKREPTTIGGAVTIHGRLIIDGEDIQDEEFPKPCCYPKDCAQAKNNPDTCSCLYMVQCTKEELKK